MPRTRPPYPPDFRRHMVELVRAGRDPEDLAREFEPSGQTIRNWVAQANRDDGPTAANSPAWPIRLGSGAPGGVAGRLQSRSIAFRPWQRHTARRRQVDAAATGSGAGLGPGCHHRRSGHHTRGLAL